MSWSRSRTTRAAGSDVSTSIIKTSRVRVSNTARARIRRPRGQRINDVVQAPTGVRLASDRGLDAPVAATHFRGDRRAASPSSRYSR